MYQLGGIEESIGKVVKLDHDTFKLVGNNAAYQLKEEIIFDANGQPRTTGLVGQPIDVVIKTLADKYGITKEYDKALKHLSERVNVDDHTNIKSMIEALQDEEIHQTEIKFPVLDSSTISEYKKCQSDIEVQRVLSDHIKHIEEYMAILIDMLYNIRRGPVVCIFEKSE